MKSKSYMTRALQAHDPRYAVILGNLSYSRADMRAKVIRKPKAKEQISKPVSGALGDLRKEYQAVFGKRAFNGWDAETIKAKLSEAKDAK